MIINGQSLLNMKPIKEMVREKINYKGSSFGLSEAGYDIRIKQSVNFIPQGCDYSYAPMRAIQTASFDLHIVDLALNRGRFTLASAIEEFDMPWGLVGKVHDKSTWARRGLSVFNTVIEPGWKGYLTLELVYHGQTPLHIPAGCGIAQVIFEEALEHRPYNGKYQNQEDRPVEAILKG